MDIELLSCSISELNLVLIGDFDVEREILCFEGWFERRDLERFLVWVGDGDGFDILVLGKGDGLKALWRYGDDIGKMGKNKFNNFKHKIYYLKQFKTFLLSSKLTLF